MVSLSLRAVGFVCVSVLSSTGSVTPVCSVSCDANTCEASSIIAEGPNTQSCRCDGHCSFFQDCCKDVEQASSQCTMEAYTDTNSSLWSCHSIYPTTVNLTQYSPEQVGVYAVSECPSTWDAQSQRLNLSVNELQLVSDLCEMANSTLPIVSDASTGRVYKNEYCAFCHEISHMFMWRDTVFCSSTILDLIHDELQLSSAVIKEQCGSCIFSTPPTLYFDQVRNVTESPRSCTPALSSCPDFSQRVWQDWAPSADDYQEIVQNCINYTVYVQTTNVHPEVYKNHYCATCNLRMESPTLQCFDSDLFPFPFCKSDSYSNNGEVSIVLDAALKTAEVPDGSSVPLGIECPPGQVFSFLTFNCRAVSCSRFNAPNSNFTCSINGLSTGNGSNNASECSNELVLDNPLLLLPMSKNTYYYYPLFALVFVSYTNALGYPVVCLDFAVPTRLPILEALNVLTFLITIPSMIVLGCVIFVYLATSMRTVYGLVIANFAIACFFADMALLLGYSGMILSRSNTLCFSAGVMDHAFSLCQFYWLLVYTLDVAFRHYKRVRSLPPNFTLRVLFAYYTMGWFLPLIITSFEVAFVYALPSVGMGSPASCFQISSLYFSFFMYIVPGSLALTGSLVIYLIFLYLLKKASFNLPKKDKIRFAVLSALLAIMSVSFLVRVAGLYIPSSFGDIIIGFLHLAVVAVRSAYLGAVLLLKKKVPKALIDTVFCINNKVASATAEEVEMATVRRDDVGNEQTQMNRELDLLAAQLANPSLYVFKE